MRTTVHQFIGDPDGFKSQLLCWAQDFREVVFLDGNDYPATYSSYDCVLAVDALTAIQTDFRDAFEDLRQYRQTTGDWLFGYLSYDLKNDTEKLSSNNFDGLQFPDLFFFQPKKLFLLKGNDLQISYLRMCDDEIDRDFQLISKAITPTNHLQPIAIRQRIDKAGYLAKIDRMLSHIHRGDIYEANFCMEFFAEEVVIEPSAIYQKLNSISNPPFAAFLKNNRYFALSASPERYLRKQGSKIISQPIKGTARRSSDAEEDRSIRTALESSEKERSENIMIVDLVRNDLSRTAAKGSVVVEELCGAHTFSQVHHLVSTIVSESDKTCEEILKTTFPMGSMTGAPKISAMNIIENLEETRRGLYSGAIGYFTPNGDFDFNVVIRSILYNSQNRYLSFSVGSAITALSDPESEYEECLIKAKAMREVLQ